jgi:hypothetical protein
LGTPSSGTATNLTGLPLTTGVAGLLPVANGGTGTATPALVAGTNVTISGTWPNQTVNATGGSGGGDVSGPGSSTDNAVARFDSTTGKIIQNSGVVINDTGEVTVGVWKGTEIGLSYGGTGGASASQARSNILPSYSGNAGKVLAVNAGATDVEYISAGGVGTVTSVGGTGTVNGLSLSGTVTSSGNLTLGGTLDLSSPPAIGGTAAAAVTGTTVTGTTKVVSPFFDAVNSAGGALRNASGTSQIQWGGGGGNNVSVDVSANLNGVNAQIDISPTGTGHVHINPTGSGSVEIKPTSAGTINNMAIGGLTPAAGAFTTVTASTAIGVASGGTGATSLTANNVILGNGTSAVQVVAPGTNGNVLTSNGTTWASTAPASGGASISNDTSTATNVYPLFAAATSGTPTTVYTSNAKLLYKPSTGEFQASQLVASNGIIVNATTVAASYTIASGFNAMSVGPITVASGQSVTVTSGQRWVVL